MGGGGIVAVGVVLIIAGAIVPGMSAQRTLVQAGGYQVTETTYPYAPLGQMMLVLGMILVPLGFIAMAVSASSRRRQEREQGQERRQLYDFAARTATPTYVPPPPFTPQIQSVQQAMSAPEFRFFCPNCGQRLSSDFCPDDGTKTKLLGNVAS